MTKGPSATSRVIIPGAVNGIDVSSIQKNLDAAKIKEAGFEFAYVQSSRYSSTKEHTFDYLVDKLRTAGLVCGPYHFLSHNSDPIEQAGFFYRASGGLGKVSGELPPLVDFEHCTPSVYEDTAKYPLGHPAHCVDFAERFMAECERLWYSDNANRVLRRHPVIYSYPVYLGSHQPSVGSSKLGNYPFCYASYPSKKGYVPASQSELPFHKIPKPWKSWQLTQYSGNDGAAVPGVSGACDRMCFGGSRIMWREFLGYYEPEVTNEELCPVG